MCLQSSYSALPSTVNKSGSTDWFKKSLTVLLEYINLFQSCGMAQHSKHLGGPSRVALGYTTTWHETHSYAHYRGICMNISWSIIRYCKAITFVFTMIGWIVSCKLCQRRWHRNNFFCEWSPIYIYIYIYTQYYSKYVCT